MCTRFRPDDGRAWRFKPGAVAPFAALLFLAAAATAQDPEDPIATLRRDLDDLKRRYEERLGALDRRLTDLEVENAALREAAAVADAEAQPQAAAPPLEPTPPPSVAGPAGDATQTSNYFNPAIAVVGNFLGVAGHSGTDEELPSAELRESELSLQGVIDPYARADLFIAFGEEGVEIEEGYVTLTALPANLLAKIGRMRAAFGKVNTLHAHSLPWPDQPLPLENLLGGEEGWIGTGVSLAGLIPLPADTFSEATLQVFGGESELFSPQEREDLAYNLHYRVFRDLTDATNLDLGLSWAHGPNGLTTASDTELWGLDTTWRWKPLQSSLYRAVTLHGEVYNSRRDQVDGDLPEIDSIQDAIGWFVAGEYQFARRWSTGLRYEWSERADDESLHDRGEAATLTFSPSEFSRLRAEYRRRHFAEDTTSDELLLQLQFLFGAHSAHAF